MVGCLFAGSIADAQAPARDLTVSSPVVKARTTAMSEAVRDVRANAVKKAPAAGQLLIDASKIGAKGTAAVRVVASDLAGRPVPVEAGSDGRWSLRQDNEKWIVVKPAESSPIRMTPGLQWLPGVCVPPTSNPGTAAGDTFSSYLEFGTVPVAWDTALDAYRIMGHVGVAKNSDERLAGDLGKAALVKFSFEGVRDPAAPDYTITRTGIDGEQPVDLKFAGTLTTAPALIVRCSLADTQKYTMDVQPRLALEAVSNPILGLGLEKTTVFVRAVRADQATLPLGGVVPVAIACAGGRSEGAASLAITAPEARPSFQVRSMGVGDLHIVANASTAEQALAGSLTLRQVMPWAQVLAALVGGALGGYLRRFMKGARSRVAGRRVAEGVMVGLVAFVAGVLGVGFFSLPEIIVATVAGAFLTGTAGGFAGVTLLETLAKPKTA